MLEKLEWLLTPLPNRLWTMLRALVVFAVVGLVALCVYAIARYGLAPSAETLSEKVVTICIFIFSQVLMLFGVTLALWPIWADFKRRLQDVRARIAEVKAAQSPDSVADKKQPSGRDQG